MATSADSTYNDSKLGLEFHLEKFSKIFERKTCVSQLKNSVIYTEDELSSVALAKGPVGKNVQIIMDMS